MQTSFHGDVLNFSRAPDVSGSPSDAQRYNASGESLEALKTRTTPIDITNPFTSSHASCANAYIATAISIEHRYDEIHLQLPVAVNPSTAVVPAVTDQMVEVAVPTSPSIVPETAQPALHQEAETRWNFDLLETAFSSPLPQFWLPQPSLQMTTTEVTALPEQSDSEPHPLLHVKPAAILENEVTISSPYVQENGEVSFSGNAPTGSLLNFYLNDVLIGSTEINDGSYWQFNLPAQLPATQHTFSAVSVSSTGAMGSKVDSLFIIEPKLGAILLPVIEGEGEIIDLALIDLVTQQDELTVTLLPQVLLDEMLNSRQSLHGLSVMEPMQHIGVFDLDELQIASTIW
jgi:hypothetical protein